MTLKKNIKTNVRQALICLLWGGVSLCCIRCSHSDGLTTPVDPEAGEAPISFRSTVTESESAQPAPALRGVATRGTLAGLETVANSFCVYAFKHYPEDGTNVWHPVMNKYQVYAKEISVDVNKSEWQWNYEQVSGQNIKYWDYSADKYGFFAFAPFEHQCAEATYINGMGKIPNVKMGYEKMNDDGSVSLEEDFFIPYYTRPCIVEKADYGKPVQLTFAHILCKVRFGFCLDVSVEQAYQKVLVDRVELAPTEGVLCNKADVYVDYNVDESGQPSVNLSFTPQTFTPSFTSKSEQIVFGVGTLANESKIYPISYHLFPSKNMGTQRKQFKVRAVINGETREVVLSLETTAWEPNKIYTYIFKINNAPDAQADDIRLYAVEVQEWQDGGYAENKEGTTEDW